VAETSKCITVSVEQPQPVVTIEKVFVTRDGVETTTIYKNENLSRYDFGVRVTVSNATVAYLTIKLIVNNVEVVSGTLTGVSPSTFTWKWTGEGLRDYKGWVLVQDMLNAVGAGDSTTVDICQKLEW